jgi:hypothetical protein
MEDAGMAYQESETTGQEINVLDIREGSGSHSPPKINFGTIKR